jgi:carbon-monoxide dehydrogenase medium subunit
MQEIDYEAPASLEAAVAALSSRADARPFAGGTDLLVRMRGEPPSAGALVDLKKIPELNSIALDSAGLRLGAAVSCWEISIHKGMRETYPGLVEAAELIGSMQIQNRASLGGNVCNASPAADTVPALIAVGARCSIAGPDGPRNVAVADFATGPGQTVLRPGELLVEFEVPAPAPGSSDAYLRFIPRGEMDIAVVGAGVSVTLDAEGTCTAARVALGAVGPTAIVANSCAEALVGTSIDDDALQRVAAAARSAATPIGDKRGTAEYRRTVSGVLARRGADIAAQRAKRRRN